MLIQPFQGPIKTRFPFVYVLRASLFFFEHRKMASSSMSPAFFLPFMIILIAGADGRGLREDIALDGAGKQCVVHIGECSDDCCGRCPRVVRNLIAISCNRDHGEVHLQCYCISTCVTTKATVFLIACSSALPSISNMNPSIVS